MEVVDADSMAEAAAAIARMGPRNVLVKGGHLREATASDVLVSSSGTRVFSRGWIDSPHTHGTGCVYAAAIATRLAHGVPLEDAIEGAKAFVTESIRHGLPLGAGRGPTDPLFRLHRDQAGSTEEGARR